MRRTDPESQDVLLVRNLGSQQETFQEHRCLFLDQFMSMRQYKSKIAFQGISRGSTNYVCMLVFNTTVVDLFVTVRILLLLLLFY
jgi:hypothetical protein